MSCCNTNNNLIDGYGLGPLGTGCPCDNNAISSRYVVGMAPISASDKAKYVRSVKMQYVKGVMANAQKPAPKCHINTGNQIGVL
jgi:hypothetical protein